MDIINRAMKLVSGDYLTEPLPDSLTCEPNMETYEYIDEHITDMYSEMDSRTLYSLMLDAAVSTVKFHISETIDDE